MLTLNNDQIQELITTVFGSCTVVGECYSVEELREDLEQDSDLTFRQWFNIRLTIEENELWPEWKYPDGPTQAQYDYEMRRRDQLLFPLCERFDTFCVKHNLQPIPDLKAKTKYYIEHDGDMSGYSGPN